MFIEPDGSQSVPSAIGTPSRAYTPMGAVFP